MDDYELTPGPWYALRPHEKAWLWLRFQPLHKVRSLGWWLKGTAEWYGRFRWLPKRDPESAWCLGSPPRKSRGTDDIRSSSHPSNRSWDS